MIILGTHVTVLCGPGGSADLQAVIFGICFFLLLAFLGKKTVLLGVLFIIILSVRLWAQSSYLEIVTKNEYAGSLHAGEFAEKFLTANLAAISDLMKLEGIFSNDQFLYEEGWLRDHDIYKKYAKFFPRVRGHQHTITPFWHSWLTRIYRRKTTDVEIWYPGGLLSEGISKLEYRERK
ncbi:MAG: hypothetical protein ACMUJM_24710 [bacterium]